MNKTAIPMCTCNIKNPTTPTKLHEVSVDKEGICDHCGHYAIWISTYILYARNGVTGIGGYLPVALNPKPGWSTNDIENYLSDVPFTIIEHNSKCSVGYYRMDKKRRKNNE